MELSHQLPGNDFGIGSTCFADLVKFNHIQASLPQLQPANQAVFSTQFFGQLPLRQSGFLAQGRQSSLQMFALPRIDSFIHGRILRAVFICFQNAGRRYLPYRV